MKEPKLRFKEFQDEWKEFKLNELCSFVNGRAYKQEELLDSGKYKVIRVGNFYTDRNMYYSNMELNDDKYINNGDLLYTWSATFGPHIWNGNKSIYHYHIWKIKINPQLTDKRFLLQLLYVDKNNMKTNGGTMAHITKKTMEDKKVFVPSLKEQREIGAFFGDLDNQIELQSDKLETLKRDKKGYLQKMFPSDDSNTPKLRLKGFSDEWKESKIKNLGTVKAGGDVNKSKLSSEGEYPVLANALNDDGIIGYYDDYKIESPAVTITGRGSVGVAVARNYNFTPVVRLLTFKSDKMDAKFMELAINHIQIFNESTGVPQLTGIQLQQYKIKYPSYKEQILIGEFISNLDKQIELQQRKVTDLKNQKKAYLQKMFI